MPLKEDELWHWPVVVMFGGGLPDLEVLATYYSGPGPLSYVLWGNLYALGAGPAVLRATSMLAALIAAAGLVRVARELGASSAAILTTFILVQPYIFSNAFFLMSDCIALALAVWALAAILTAVRTAHVKHWALGVLAIAAVLYTRFPYLSIPFGLGVAGLMDRTVRRKALATSALALAAVGPLVALWGGFATLTVQSIHDFDLELRHFNHMLVWLGFFWWPYLVTRVKWTPPPSWTMYVFPVVLIGVLTAWFLPFDSYWTRSAGPVSHALVLSGELGPPWLRVALHVILWMTGGATLTCLVFRSWRDRGRRIILMMALCAATLPAVSQFWWERHAIPVYLFTGLLAWSEPMKRRTVVVAWLSFLVMFALAHLIQAVLT